MKLGFTLEFTNPRGDPVRLGPIEQLRFERHRLLAGHGEILAEHHGHKWILRRGGSYARLECPQPFVLCFESNKHMQSRDLGPYKTLSAVDGILYGEHRILAFCDTQMRDWYSYDLGTHWPCIVIKPQGSDGLTSSLD